MWGNIANTIVICAAFSLYQSYYVYRRPEYKAVPTLRDRYDYIIGKIIFSSHLDFFFFFHFLSHFFLEEDKYQNIDKKYFFNEKEKHDSPPENANIDILYNALEDECFWHLLRVAMTAIAKFAPKLNIG